MDYRMIVILCAIFHSAVSDSINFDLSAYTPSDKSTHVYKQYYIANSTNGVIRVNNIGDDVGFIVVQVHSHLNQVYLAYNLTKDVHQEVYGKNIGLVYAQDSNSTTFYLNDLTYHMVLLVVVTVYTQRDPVPGGCNLTFNTKLAPYQMISEMDEIISVHHQAPMAYNLPCDDNSILLEKYHLFLPEYDNKESTYFAYMQKMLTPENIKANGHKVPNLDGYLKYMTYYSSYRGTGEIFAIVATYQNMSSAYIPAVTYACDIFFWEKDCLGPITTHWKFVIATYFIIGLFICFFGHEFFQTTLVAVGFAIGVLLAYIFLTMLTNYSFTEISTASLCFGCLYALLGLYIWRKKGVPLITILPTLCLSGFLFSSLMFFSGIGNQEGIFGNNLNYKLTFTIIIFIVIVLQLLYVVDGHIFACSFLGSYACITALNYYYGGYYQYVIINVIRAIINPKFVNVITEPPFKQEDVIITLIWCCLFGFGFVCQSRKKIGRPPFPPHRTAPPPEIFASDRTPLLHQHVPEYV